MFNRLSNSGSNSGISGSGFIISGISGAGGFSGFIYTGQDLSGILSGTGAYNQENCCQFSFTFKSEPTGDVSKSSRFFSSRSSEDELANLINEIYRTPNDSDPNIINHELYNELKNGVVSQLAAKGIQNSSDWKKCGCTPNVSIESSFVDLETPSTDIDKAKIASASENKIPSGVIPTGIETPPTFIYCLSKDIENIQANQSGQTNKTSISSKNTQDFNFLDRNAVATFKIECPESGIRVEQSLVYKTMVSSGSNSGLGQAIEYDCVAFGCNSGSSSGPTESGGIIIDPIDGNPPSVPPIWEPPIYPPIYPPITGIDPCCFPKPIPTGCNPPPINPPFYYDPEIFGTTCCKDCISYSYWGVIKSQYKHCWCNRLISPAECKKITGLRETPSGIYLTSGIPLYGSSNCWVKDMVYRGCCSGTFLISGSGNQPPIYPDPPVEPQPPNPNPPQPYTPKLIIEDIIYYNNPEIVVIRNVGEKSQNMAGWTILSHDGTIRPSCPALAEKQTFRFPSVEIPAGGRLLILSDSKASETVSENPGMLLWNNTAIWNNIADIGILYNEKNVAMDTFVYGECFSENQGCYKLSSASFAPSGSPTCSTTANLTFSDKCFPSKYLAVKNGLSGFFNINCPSNSSCRSRIISANSNDFIKPTESMERWIYEDCPELYSNTNPDGVLNFSFERCSCFSTGDSGVVNKPNLILEIEAQGAGGTNGTSFWQPQYPYMGGGGGGFVKANAEIKNDEDLFIFVGAPTNRTDYSIFPNLSVDSLVALDDNIIVVAEGGGLALPGKIGECYHLNAYSGCRKGSYGGSGYINNEIANGKISIGCNGIKSLVTPHSKYVYLDQSTNTLYKTLYSPVFPNYCCGEECNDGSSASKTSYGQGGFKIPLRNDILETVAQPGFVKISYPGNQSYTVSAVGFEPNHIYNYNPASNTSTHTFYAPRTENQGSVQYLNGYFIMKRI